MRIEVLFLTESLWNLLRIVDFFVSYIRSWYGSCLVKHKGISTLLELLYWHIELWPFYPVLLRWDILVLFSSLVHCSDQNWNYFILNGLQLQWFWSTVFINIKGKRSLHLVLGRRDLTSPSAVSQNYFTNHQQEWVIYCQSNLFNQS